MQNLYFKKLFSFMCINLKDIFMLVNANLVQKLQLFDLAIFFNMVAMHYPQLIKCTINTR